MILILLMKNLVIAVFCLENVVWTSKESLDSCTLIIASLDSSILFSHCFITLHLDVENSMHLHYAALNPTSTKSANKEASSADGII